MSFNESMTMLGFMVWATGGNIMYSDVINKYLGLGLNLDINRKKN